MKKDKHQTKLDFKQFKEELVREFASNTSILATTRSLVTYVDALLLNLFQKHQLEEENVFCLLAVGSYGRRELQLHSDIDLLLIHEANASKAQLQKAQRFIQDCWDSGLEISHQLTTVEACADLAQQDLTVISSILDMHLLCGRTSLMEALHYQTHTLHMWPSEDFFCAKQAEQQRRYQKYRQTAYNLEPNVKYGPGGLRDLQLLLSIGKRHFNIKKLADGISCGFLKEKEYEELMNCQHFLWRVRFALHALSGKQEERLLFDYQAKLADMFGLRDLPHSLAIEQFMKMYFKVIKRNREVNEMLLQWFSEAIIHHEKQQITALDDYFQLSNNFIEVKNPRVFSNHPVALLQLFLWIAKRPDISGVRANTIRQIREDLYLMNKKFRHSAIAIKCFKAIFKQKNPYQALHHMNRYGVLAQYLECFALVSGQMQYDLFHVYTVDQHTLFVIRNLVAFLEPESAQQFSLANRLMPHLRRRDIVYLAALFHDIAKGRGGDHSELGAIEAHHFAVRHKLAPEDAELLCWLVTHHLLMSQTAQRKDIYDPKTIHHFCSLLPKPYYLDYLYLLTVADICATNESLWNSWKDSLLKELYRAAKQLLQDEQLMPNEKVLIESRQQEAMQILAAQGLAQEKVMGLWQTIKSTYFLHESPSVIARHSKAILECESYPLVLIMPHHSQAAIEVFIYMPHRDDRFSIATTVLSNQQVSIQEATISTSNNYYDLDIYIILDEQHQPIHDAERLETIRLALVDALSQESALPRVVKRRLSRTQAHFKFKPQITFDEESSTHTRLFLVSSDMSGLLAQISRIFASQNIVLHNAKIATAGERVEDMFYISTGEGHALDDTQQKALTKKLLDLLA